MIDPYKATKKSYDLHDRLKDERIIEAKVYDNGFCFLTTGMRF